MSSFGPASATSDAGQEQEPKPTIDLIDWPSLEGLEPPPRRWVINQLIPCGLVSGIWGVGGVGKSMLAQQLASCTALRRDFLGMATNGKPVLYVTTEEDHDEAWRRQYAINKALGLSMTDLAGKLFITPRRGEDNALAKLNRYDDLPEPTPLMHAVEEEALRVGAQSLILDNLTQVFAAEDHKRHSVTAYLNQQAGVAARLGEDGAVVLVGHVSKTKGSEFGGSQAWNDGVRARMLLTRDEKNPDIITFALPKANYAREKTIALTWRDDILRPVAPELMSENDRVAAGLRAESVRERFLAALDKLNGQGVNTSHKPGSNYAPKAMRNYADDVLGDATDAELKDAMRVLIRDGKIAHGPVGTYANRSPRLGLRRVPDGGGGGRFDFNAQPSEAKPGPKARAVRSRKAATT